MIKRLNKSCAYFPCHKGLGDCTFCYCPFYPCENAQLGEYVLTPLHPKNANLMKKGVTGLTKDRCRIWSCKDCNWIHKKKVVDNLFNLLKEINHKPAIKLSRVSCDVSTKTGIIILGHGSLLKQANETIIRVIKEIKKKRDLTIIEPAYLQLCKPNLHTTVKKIIKKGCRKIIVVPFFLFRGNHVSRDIPRMIKKEAKGNKNVEFVYAKSLGQDKRISDIVLDCIKAAL